MYGGSTKIARWRTKSERLRDKVPKREARFERLRDKMSKFNTLNECAKGML